MKKVSAFAAATAMVILCAAAAYAYTLPDVITVAGKATPGGKPAKPKVISAGFANQADGPGGVRASTPNSLGWKFAGVHFNGKLVPSCTADQIDAKQSDSVCPPKALVGAGKVTALLGPSGDPTSNITCEKDLKVYSAGAKGQTLYIYGDPAKCAGVNYLAPAAMTVTKGKSGDTVTFPVGDNLQHPLPGLDGGIQKLSIDYKKIKVKKGKKKSGFLTSVGCGKAKNRKVSFFTGYANPEFDDSTVSASAGKC